MSSTSKWLRQAAEEIRREGRAGWGNTCEQAADDYDALAARLADNERAYQEAFMALHAAKVRLAEAERWIRYWMPDPAALHAYYRKPYADTQAFLGEADSRSGG